MRISLSEIQNKIPYDDFYKMYITDNLTYEDIAEAYGYKKRSVSHLNQSIYHIEKSPEMAAISQQERCMRKFGVSNHGQRPEVKDKIKETCMRKYGISNGGWCNAAQEKIRQYHQSLTAEQKQAILHKMQQTCIEHFGVDNPQKCQAIKDKTKETNIRLYGSPCALLNPDIREKTIETNLMRYGTIYPAASEIIKNKYKNTMLNNYGVDNYFKIPSFYEICKSAREKTMLEKYGYIYSSQNKDVYAKIKQTTFIHYGYTSILLDPKTREHIQQTMLSKYGVNYGVETAQCIAALKKVMGKGIYSKPNVVFEDLLKRHNISFEREFSIGRKRYDFKVNNFLIEINPSSSHNTIYGPYNKNGLDKNYHFEKTMLAKNNNFQCIHVWDWDDLNKIINIVSNKQKIYARKCEIKEIKYNKEVQEFLNQNHMQGNCKNQKYIFGLYYHDILVELISFGKPRYNKKYQYELLRLCISHNYIVVGGAERLFNEFIKKYNPISIISYCDNSKFSGHVYERLGFILKSFGNPSCHWYNNRKKIHITDNLLRQRGFDQLFKTSYGKNSSNNELMLSHGFVPIYDSGQSVYFWLSKKSS